MMPSSTQMGAIDQGGMPPTLAGRFVRRKDGGYLDTKTGAVYPNEESLPKGALDASQGAIAAPAAPSGSIVPRSILGIGQKSQPVQTGAISATDATPQPRSGWGAPPLPGRFPPPIQIPQAQAVAPPPAPTVGGIAPMVPKPAASDIADISKYLNLHPSASQYADVGATMPSAQSGGIDPMLTPPKPLAAQPAAATVPQQSATQPPQTPQMGGLDPLTALETTSAPNVGAPAGPNAVSPQFGMGAHNAAPNGAARPQAGAIDPNAVQDALAAHSAPGAGAVPITPVQVGGISPKDMQASIGTQLDANPTPLGPETHEGDWLDRLGGAIGIGDGTSTLSGEETDDRNNAILRTGLAMMAAGGKPGSTLGGAAGEGGLYAMEAADKDKDRKEAMAFRKQSFNAEQSNKKAMLNLDIAKWLTGEKHQERQDEAADTRNKISDKTATATAAWRANQVATSGQDMNIKQQNADSAKRRNDLTEAQQSITRQRNSDDALNMKDQRAEQDYATRLRAANNPLDPTGGADAKSKAESDAAFQNWDSRLGQNYANQQLAKYQQAYQEAVAKGDDVKAKQAQDGMAQITAHFFRDVKQPPK